MKVVGVVSEYNPFHLGHQYHLEQIRLGLSPDAICCIMSGNYVQRGEPSLFNKWARAEMALAQGVDLVFELPVCFSTATAEIFAQSAVDLLHQTKTVNYISFGVEEDCHDILIFLGRLLADEPDELKLLIKRHLGSGISFASARESAVLDYFSLQNYRQDLNILKGLFKKPNFILGLEYVKALNRLKAKIDIYPIIRFGGQYHDINIGGVFPSASAIRTALKSGRDLDAVINSIPKSTRLIMRREMENCRGPVYMEDFEQLILYSLRRLSLSEIRGFFDIGEGLEYRIRKASGESKVDKIVSLVKTKRYPEAKIKRILLHSLLDIQGSLVSLRKPLYFRVLGFSNKGAQLLRIMKKKVSIPIVTKASDYKMLDPDAKTMFEKDLFSSQVYSLAHSDADLRKDNEFSKNVIYWDCDKY